MNTLTVILMIRPMMLCDIPQVVGLGHQMHKESPIFRGNTFDPQKVTSLLQHSLVAPQDMCVFVNSECDELTGGIIGIAQEHWYGPDREAADVALFIRKDKRGGMLAARLIRAYEKWAKKVGVTVVNLGVSTGIHVDKTAALYERLGYSQPSTNLRKKI